ncbi:MAG: hypothetical protein Q9157_005674 [Trypethelium eluteriae]
MVVFAWILPALLPVSAIATSLCSNGSELAPDVSHAGQSQKGPDSYLVKDSYIIKLKNNYSIEEHVDYIGSNVSSIGHDYYYLDIFSGYAITTNRSVIQLIRRDPGVKWTKSNSLLYPYALLLSPAGRKDQMKPSSRQQLKRWRPAIQSVPLSFTLAMQSAAQKLSRFTRDRPLYWALDDAGRTVDIYVLDSGIDINHPEFEGRASNFRGWNTSPFVPLGDPRMGDLAGHGTCVASVAGGRLTGTAKHANLINVKIGDVITTELHVISAIIQVITEHKNKKRTFSRDLFAGSVINWSFGGYDTNLFGLESIIQQAKAHGILTVTAAGNENTDAAADPICKSKDIICVGAVDQAYRKTPGSNYGEAITVSAPGHDIVCAAPSIYSNLYTTTSGTSLAAAYVSGTTAQFIGYEKLRSDTGTIIQRMRDNWNVGFLQGFPSRPATPNTFNSNGFKKPNKSPDQPYVGAPA